jgi:hypothetical protein
MKRSATVLILSAVLALVLCTQCLASQTPQTPQIPAVTSPADLATFLASLSGGLSNTPGTETFCTTDADCPTGEICCYPCGIDGCEKACTTPWRGHLCPPIP